MIDFWRVSCLPLQLSLAFLFCREQFRCFQNVQAAYGNPAYQQSYVLPQRGRVVVEVGSCNGTPVIQGEPPHWRVETSGSISALDTRGRT